jgi:hypothetical protein
MELKIDNEEWILSTLKVYKDWKISGRYDVSISILNIPKSYTDIIRDALRGNNPIKPFGKFDLPDKNLRIYVNDFYAELRDVKLTTYQYIGGDLHMTFKGLDNFSYVSGKGVGVKRDRIIKEILDSDAI